MLVAECLCDFYVQIHIENRLGILCTPPVRKYSIARQLCVAPNDSPFLAHILVNIRVEHINIKTAVCQVLCFCLIWFYHVLSHAKLLTHTARIRCRLVLALYSDNVRPNVVRFLSEILCFILFFPDLRRSPANRFAKIHFILDSCKKNYVCVCVCLPASVYSIIISRRNKDHSCAKKRLSSFFAHWVPTTHYSAIE